MKKKHECTRRPIQGVQPECNGCHRCPPTDKPCQEPRHSCMKCGGIGVIGLISSNHPVSCDHR